MTEADARYAVELLDALENLPDVQKGLALEKDRMKLELGAFEGDYRGGTGHGDALLPIKLGLQIVAFAEDLIRRELRRLRVSPEGEADPAPAKHEGKAKGGRARAASMSAEQRSLQARGAANARWGNGGAAK